MQPKTVLIELAYMSHCQRCRKRPLLKLEVSTKMDEFLIPSTKYAQFSLKLEETSGVE